ncbi:MAG TPA: helix-turn-helix domain-containing protein [Terriglobales bacterium]|nr:helix-turn-helix domain-containing protein [Terriglobales bacterium]
MSRTTNPELTEKIVAAAFRLFHDRGEKGLTLRAVARAAGTTPPSVYQRFPAKQDLVAALGDRARLRLGREVMKAPTLEAAFRNYLAVAQRYPQLYRLVFGPNLRRVLEAATRRPLLEWFQQQFKRRLGGTPAEQENRAYGAFLLLHGTASILQYAPGGQLADEIRARCLLACDALLRDGRRRKRPSRRS